MKWNETYLKTRGYVGRRFRRHMERNEKKAQKCLSNRRILCHIQFVSFHVRMCGPLFHSDDALAWIQWQKYCKHMRYDRKLRFTDVSWAHILSCAPIHLFVYRIYTFAYDVNAYGLRLLVAVFRHAYLHSSDIIETLGQCTTNCRCHLGKSMKSVSNLSCKWNWRQFT